GQNTVHVRYRLVSGTGTLRLKLRPSLHFRPHESAVSEQHPGPYTLTTVEKRYEVRSTTGPTRPPLPFYLPGQRTDFTWEQTEIPDIHYSEEEFRGYESHGMLWSPGYFRADLAINQSVTLVASTESWETILTLSPEEAFAAEHERCRRLIAEA